MPEIRQYAPQSSPIGAVSNQAATGQDFGAGIGEAQQQLGQQIEKAGQVVNDIATQKDVASMNANLATAKDRLGLLYKDQLQKGTLDHNSFMQYVGDQMDSVQDGVNTPYGQQRFNQLKAQTQLEFSQQAQVGEAQLTGEQAVQNLKLFTDKNSSYLENNPLGFQNALKQKDDYIDDLVANHGLPAEKASELKTAVMTEFAKGAVRGLMQTNPQEAKAELDSGKWDPYMNADVKYKMDVETDRYQRAQETEAARRQKLAQDAADARQEAAKESMLQKLYGDGLSTDDILKSKDLDEGAKEHMLSLIKTRNEDKIVTDNSTTRTLFNQIHLADDDPNKYIKTQDDLNKYVVNGSINFDALKLLRGEFVGKGTIQGDADAKATKAFENMAFQAIAKPDPTTHLPDPQGAANYQSWLTDYLQKKQNGLANGKKMSDMTDPKSPDYLGNNFSQYQRTPEQIINDMAAKMKAGQNPAAAPEPMVKVLDPQGRVGQIPKSKLDAAKARGYKVQ